MLRLYNTTLLPLRAVAALYAAWAGRDPERRLEWQERRARRLPRIAPHGLWIHGASVGEVSVLRLLAAALRARRPALPIAVSATTPAGRAQLPEPPAVDASFYLPLDFAGLPGRILDAVRPAALVLVETELWPNLLRDAATRSIPVAVVNARLAPERMARYRKLRPLLGNLLRALARVGAQTEDEARRFAEIGVPASRITVTGNVKYDLPAPSTTASELRARFGLGGRPVLVAGSTGEGEDGVILDAFLAVRARVPTAFLVLAPRHVARAEAARAEAASRGLALHPLSSRDDAHAGAEDGLLVDTLGELRALYALGAAAFVGGSLVEVGGHNVLEPAAAGVAVLFGPHTHHVEEPSRALLARGGARRVANGAELAEAFTALVTEPALARKMGEAARSVVEEGRGSLERTLDLLLALAGRTLEEAS